VLRALVIAAILCCSFELSGLAAAWGDPDCSEDCPSERSGAPCPPNCHACSCCSLPKITPPVPTLADLPRPEARSIAWPWTSDLPRSPDPADILHVPRRRAA
jgi:hypothetical protein